MRLVEMFHAGTPENVKHHILEQLTNTNGHIRVLVCTIAFGMGVDCQYITKIVHYGGSNSCETYLQECGRAGRRGEPSLEILLFNGCLLKHSDQELKNYTMSNECRRKTLSCNFDRDSPSITENTG